MILVFAKWTFSYGPLTLCDVSAQALLGQVLFDGDCLPPQRALGLMWLTLACESAGPEESWIKESYNQAMASAFASDRAKARQMLRRWLEPLRSRCGEPTAR